MHPKYLQIYLDDVAVAADSIEKTQHIAKLSCNKAVGSRCLVCNQDKTFWNLVETKPLLEAIWSRWKYSKSKRPYNNCRNINGNQKLEVRSLANSIICINS
eukprot:GHVP01032074.1.p1 GENE.GHVP01032074.1~~GHVP01032074.1.p1  ORF type:complete len:101 (+),score=7.23 GHVP01032074.1:269-571(+)